MPSAFWQDLTTRDFDGLDPETTIAVLPVAAIEQHGPHLPLATDALINAGIVDAMLPMVPGDISALILPAINIGSSSEHRNFAGTLSLEPELLLQVWLDVASDVARTGVRKLVFLNTHGGQKSIVDLAAVKLRVAHGMLAVRCSYFAFGAPEGLFSSEEQAFGFHGGEMETSLMQHLHPRLVRRDQLRDFESLAAALARKNRWLGAEKPVGIGWKSQDINPAGVAGNAVQADAERGAAYLAHIARSFAELLTEVAATPLRIITDTR